MDDKNGISIFTQRVQQPNSRGTDYAFPMNTQEGIESRLMCTYKENRSLRSPEPHPCSTDSRTGILRGQNRLLIPFLRGTRYDAHIVSMDTNLCG